MIVRISLPTVPAALGEFLPGRLGVVELLSGQEQEAALAKDFGGNPGLMEFSVRQIAQELTETGDIPGLCAPHRKRLVLLLPLDADSAVSACERLMDTVRMYLHLPMRAAVSAPSTRFLSFRCSISARCC